MGKKERSAWKESVTCPLGGSYMKNSSQRLNESLYLQK